MKNAFLAFYLGVCAILLGMGGMSVCLLAFRLYYEFIHLGEPRN